METLSQFRIIPRLEAQPGLVQFVQTIPGKILICAAFWAVLAAAQQNYAAEMALIVLAISIMPQHRRVLVAGATFYWLVARTWEDPSRTYFFGAEVVFFLSAALLLRQAQIHPEHWFFRRPVRSVLLCYCALIALVPFLPARGVFAWSVWVLIMFSGRNLWFLAYALTHRRLGAAQPTAVRLFHFQPFWGSTNVPYPKGESYLAKIEAKSAQALAVTQLKGLKLVLWAAVLKIASDIFNQVVLGAPGYLTPYLPGHLATPALPDAIAHYLDGKAYSRDLNWLAVIANFCGFIFKISIWGHFIIGGCRMAGFGALRNTYNPLGSTSIAEFYNRIYYYFKELLVDFFFYPAYLRYFKEHPRLRLFFATMSAAFFGNLLYHVLASVYQVRPMGGLWRYLYSFHVYAVYALILGLAIAASQIRSLNVKRNTSLLNTAGVLLFYALLMVLDSGRFGWSIVDYGSFILNLFIPFPRH